MYLAVHIVFPFADKYICFLLRGLVVAADLSTLVDSVVTYLVAECRFPEVFFRNLI